MRFNGHLTYQLPRTDDVVFNDDGEPVEAQDQQSEQVKCFVKTNTHSEKGVYADGKFTQESYEILTQRGSVPTDIDFVHVWKGKKYLGEFEVQDLQEISLDRIKIIV